MVVMAKIQLYFAVAAGAMAKNGMAVLTTQQGTLNMATAGVLAIFTEFIGAVALGKRVSDTIKNGMYV
jgi:phosphate/sulfate permease